jgi:hypothetical protein
MPDVITKRRSRILAPAGSRVKGFVQIPDAQTLALNGISEPERAMMRIGLRVLN